MSKVAQFFFAGLVLTLVACGGDVVPGSSVGVNILAVEPPVAAPGEQITILGSDLIGLGTPNTVVKIGGVPATIVSSDSLKIVAIVPPGAGSTVSVTTDINTGTFDQWKSGTRITVPEVEPNDNTSGANATQVTTNRQSTGTLSSVADKDHFLFGNTAYKHYKVKVTPAGIIPTVYINGVGYPLDSSGQTGVIETTNTNTLVGLTGGTGSYTVDLVFQGN